MKPLNPEIYLSADGGDVMVEHTILNLDGVSFGHLNFLSSASPVYYERKLPVKQALLSQECHQILANRFPKSAFLVAQYFRPLTLGNITVELLPSGESPGSSFLRIEKKDESLLYASSWSKRITPSFRKAVVRPSKTLLLKLQKNPFDSDAHSVKREWERLQEFAGKIRHVGEELVLVADAFGDCQRLATHFHEKGFSVSSDEKFFQLTRSLYENSAASDIPPWARELKKFTARDEGEKGIILISKQHFLAHKLRTLPSGIWVSVGDDLNLRSNTQKLPEISFSEVFAINSYPDIMDIIELIQEIKAEKILVFGVGANECVEHLTQLGLPVSLFSPPLNTLF